MSQISPPIRILLVAVIGLCAAYFLFLRPKDEAVPAAPPAASTPVPAKDPNAQTSSKPGAAVQQAVRGADNASARADQAAGGAIGETESGAAPGSSTPASTGVNTNPVAQAPATGQTAAPATPVTKEALKALPKDVRKAVRDRKVLVMLFYNNRSDDDKAVRRELRQVNHYGNQVFVDAHWIKSVAKYQAITRGADVEQSPTVVVADSNLKSETLVGYVDHETINQAVVDAIRASGGSLIKNPYFRSSTPSAPPRSSRSRRSEQPASAAAVPAYLVGVQGVTTDAQTQGRRRSRPAKKCARTSTRTSSSTSRAPRQPADVGDGRHAKSQPGRRRGLKTPEPAGQDARQEVRQGERRPRAQLLLARAYTRRVSAEGFTEHLQFPQGKGYVPAGAFSGAAGGAACGDLVTVSLRVEGARVAEAGFEASGCGAVTAAGSAAVALVAGASVLDAARVGTTAIADELGGLSPGKLHAAELAADALHRALGAAARAGAAVPFAPERTLVAMSGGVDSAVAALRTGGEPVAVTLELWADEANDAEASCCSAHAVRVARSLAHGMGMPHFTLDLRAEFRAGVVEPWMAGHAAGETPNPCVGCNGHVRLDAMLEFADALGAAALATGHYARVSEDGLLRSAADPAKDQAYMLCALSPATLAAHALPARRADQARGARAGRRGRAAGRLEGRLDGPLLPRRHRPRGVPRPPRRRARAPGRDRRPRRARARPPPRPPRLHGRAAQGDRGRGARAARTCSPPTRARTA